MLKYNTSLQVAQVVINCLGIESKRNYHIQAYQNCREQGYVVINDNFELNKVAYVCRSRNSDLIVVYIGSHSNEGISEDAYKNAKEFGPIEYFRAAQYIKDQLDED